MKKLLIALLCLALGAVPALAEKGLETIRQEEIAVGDPPLPGALTIPDSPSPLPAAVLLHGSGPNDRDETLGNTKLFLDLADGLSREGIAVLRYDKRTLVYGADYTAEELLTITVREEAMLDAVAAAELLRSDPRVDPNRIYLIGHSMGAMLAPRIAAENPGLFAGIILLSGTPKTLADIVISQNQAIVDALPDATRPIGQMQLQALVSQWEAVRNGTKEQALTQLAFGQPAYYFWEMAQYDTAALLRSLPLPALIINGGADFQVSDGDGIDAWRAADLPDSALLSYHPDLNHLLMDPGAPEDIRGTAAEYNIPCHAAPEITHEIIQFIQP